MNKIILLILFVFLPRLILAQDSTMQWEKKLGGSDVDVVNSIIQTLDGGLIFTGYTGSADGDIKYNHGGNDLWVVKLKKNGEVEWEKTYGGSNGEYGAQIILTSDSCYEIVGATSSSDGDVHKNKGKLDVWAIKIDAKGKFLWEKTFGGSAYDAGLGIVLSPDGGSLVIARTASNDSDITYNHGDYDVWVLKLDKNGNLQWQKTYGSTGFDAPTFVVFCPEDSGYLIAAIPGDSNGDLTKLYGYQDAWVFKIDKSGKLLWQKTYGTPYYENINSIVRTSDSAYILVGSEGADDKFTRFFDVWAFKIKKDSNIVWDKHFGGSRNDYGESAIHTQGNGCIITGSTHSHDFDVTGYYNAGNTAMWTLEISDSGKLLWNRTNGGISYDYDGLGIAKSSDGGYVMGGTISVNSQDIVLIKLAGHWKPKIIQNSGCLPRSAKLAIDKPIASSDSLAIKWDFGDGKGYISAGDTVFTPAYTKPGNYKIKLRVMNNRHGYSGTILSEDSITVAVSGKTLSTPNIILKGKDTLVSSYTGDSCQWYRDSVLVSSGKCEFIATKSGKYQVMVFDSACPSPMSAEYNFTFVGIREEQAGSGFSLYPNPVGTALNFTQHPPSPFKGGLAQNSLPSLARASARAIITDLSGKTLLTQSIIASESILDVPMLPSGIYLFHYQDKDSVWNSKFVKE